MRLAKFPRASLESLTGEIISDSSPQGGSTHSSSGTFRVSIKTVTSLPITNTWLDSVEDFLMPSLQATLHASFTLPQTNKRSTQKQAYWIFSCQSCVKNLLPTKFSQLGNIFHALQQSEGFKRPVCPTYNIIIFF